jgi:HEAT repeat protein
LRNRILTRVRPPQAALVRPAAARALGRLGPGAAPALPELTRALQDTVNGTCWEAATALGRIGVRAVPALTAALQDEDALVRCAAARGLGEAGPEAASAVPALIQMLSRASTNEQSFAAQSLAGIGTPAVAPLINLLLHAEGAFGEAAAGALLRHYGRPGPPLPAVKDPPGDQTTAARRQAVEALRASDRDNELVTRLLAGAVKDPAPQVRLAAIQALAQGSRNPRAALPSLAAALRDESPAIREWSARVLGQLGPSAKPAVPRLIPLAQDDNPAVRAAARQALAAIDPAWKTNAAPAPR